MLIDDDNMTNFLNQRIIENLGLAHHIIIYQYAEEALTYLKTSAASDTKNPDIMLVDLNMPRMNGWEFLEHYEELKKPMEKNTSVFVLTTSMNPDDEQRSKHHEILSGYITKPLTKEKLEDIMKIHFQG